MPQKRREIVREADFVEILALRLQKVAPHKILEALNAQQVARMVIAGERMGLTREQAAAMAEEARLTPQTMRKDFREIKRRLKAGSRAGGELLILHQLEELEVERQTLLLAERRAWEHELATGEEVVEETHRFDPVEVERRDAAGAIMRGPDGVPLRDKVLKPIGVARTKGKRAPTQAWLEVVVSCVTARLKVSERMFELMACLSEPPPLPLDLAALEGIAGAAQQTFLEQVAFLYRVEARATNQPIDIARLKLLQEALERRGSPGAKKEPGEGGQMALTVRRLLSAGETTTEG